MISVLPLAWWFGSAGSWNLFVIGVLSGSIISAILSASFGERAIVFIQDNLLWP
jgi:hypothetical protein